MVDYLNSTNSGRRFFWDVTQRILVVNYRRLGQPIGLIIRGQAVPEDGTVRLSRNGGEKVPMCAASYRRIAKISFPPLRKPRLAHSSNSVLADIPLHSAPIASC